MLSKPIVVVDVETTGLDPNEDTMVQIAACTLDNEAGAQGRSFMTYVRPGRPISPAAEAVHGLSLEHLRTAPTLNSALRKFDDYVPAGAILCGHNIAFDAAFLRAAYASVGLAYPFDYHILDVWSVAFFVLETQRISLTSYNLSALCDFYGIPRQNKHDALEDAQATASILRRMLSAVGEAHLDVPGARPIRQ